MNIHLSESLQEQPKPVVLNHTGDRYTPGKLFRVTRENEPDYDEIIMLCCVDDCLFCFMCVHDGNRWSDPILIPEYRNPTTRYITEEIY